MEIKMNKWSTKKKKIMESFSELSEGSSTVEYLLCNAAKSLRRDKDVILAANEICSSALYYATKLLKNGRKFVLMIVRERGQALEYVGESLKQDRQVVLAAVEQDEMLFWQLLKVMV